jgi:hypothetical protein
MKKLFTNLGVVAFLLLGVQSTSYAKDCSPHESKNGNHTYSKDFLTSHLASSTFWITNTPYSLAPPLYPTVAPISLNATKGFSKGKLKARAYGLRINKAGDYSASFQITLLNQDVAPGRFVIYLVRNGEFSPDNAELLVDEVSLMPGEVTTLSNSGILRNVKSGTTLSLVAANKLPPGGLSVGVQYWNINAFRIDHKSKKH